MFAKYFMEGFELCGHQNGKVVDEQNGWWRSFFHLVRGTKIVEFEEQT
jgi:hypothetical protein